MLALQPLQSRNNPRRVSRKIRQKLSQFHLEELENRQLLSTTYYVATTGNDSAAGTSAAPFKTLEQAVSKLKPGDTLDIRAGSYAGIIDGWDWTVAGTASAPITIQADPAAAPGSVIINSSNIYTPDGIDFEPGCNYITIKGITVNANSSISRAGIRVGQSTGVQILNCTVTNAGTFGITTSFTTNCLIQGCTVTNTQGSGEAGHGIYVANSAVNPSVIGNTIDNNGGEGLHMNGDGSQGAPGVISGAVVEGNIIYNNGENGINSDGLVNSTIANNLVYNNARQGIVLYQISAASHATNDIIMNNTVYQPNSSGAALQLVDGSTNMVVFNNILIGGSYGSINISNDSKSGFVSDYNVVTNTFMNNDTSLTMPFATWKSTYGQDAHSTIVAASQLFVNPAGGNFQLLSNSPAIDAGTSSLSGHAALTTDLLGNPRPSGNSYDIGAYEVQSASTGTTPPTLSLVVSGGLTSSTALITWTTNVLADTQVQYGTTTAYGSSSSLNTTLALAHSATLTNLQPGTVYHYRVLSHDASGNLATSGDFTFTTAATVDVTPPVVSNITSSSVTTSSSTIAWTTNEAADSQVQYGTTTSYGTTTTLNTSLVTSHSVSLTGLSASTTYHYRVLSHDASGNLTTSGDFTFTTAALGSGPYSVFSSSTVPAITDDVDNNAVVLGMKFESSVSGSITGVRFYKGSLNTGTHVGYLWSSTGKLLASATFTNETASGWQQVNFSTPVAINANTVYVAGYYAPKGEYAAQNDAFDSSGISNGPLQILASGVSGSNGVYAYGGAGTFPTSSYLNSDYYVDVVFNTTADTTPPTISTVGASGLTISTSTVTWTTNEPANSQIQYGTTTSYGSSSPLNSALVTSHSVALSGLMSGTVYHYRVLSRDAAGNLTTSPDFTFTTVLMGDVNDDGVVDILDLNMVTSHWQAVVPVGTLGDIAGPNGVPDGKVDIFDLNAVTSNWQSSL